MTDPESTRISKTPLSDRRTGFTLVEMLVVIGLIGVLAGVLVTSMSHLKVAAKQSHAQSLVSEVATALTLYLQRNRSWSVEMVSATDLEQTICAQLQLKKYGGPFLDVTAVNDDESMNKNSLDRYGMLDPWGRAMLKAQPNLNESNVKDHRIQIRVDKNLDGYVDSSEGTPGGARVRASAIAWSRGPDGKDGTRDDRFSWSQGQALADK